MKKKRHFCYATVYQRGAAVWYMGCINIRQVNRKVCQPVGMAERSDRIHVRLQAFGDLL
jgi:hypothetical protein